MVAWIHGNTPTGQDVETGRILCEAMYACNEKEEAVGLTQSTWDAETIGAKPAMDALLGKEAFKSPAAPTAGRRIHAELQGAITAIVGRTTRPYFIDGAGNYYTLATLCTAAFGGVGFTTVSGADCEDVTLIEEILKALETLDRIDAAVVTPDHATAKGRKDLYHNSPGKATRAEARAAISGYADCGELVPGNLPGEMSNHGSLPPDYDSYDHYYIIEAYHKAEFDLPSFGSVVKMSLKYTGRQVNPYTTAYPLRFYKVSEAQYTNANTPGPEGDLIFNFTTTYPSGVRIDDLDDISWLTSVGSGVYYYFKMVRGAGDMWPDDRTYYMDDVSYDNPGGGQGFYCRYDGDWTYN